MPGTIYYPRPTTTYDSSQSLARIVLCQNSCLDDVRAAQQGLASIMTSKQTNNPLHGITLESVVTRLVDHYGWDELASRININCFKNDPSVKSSLKFLRKTPWAREQVERLYVATFQTKQT